MGQKVNPIGFRTGIMIGWKSRWYASKQEFADLLVEDQRIRDYVKSRKDKFGKPLYPAIAKIEIERTRDEVKVVLFSARPGLLIGRKGERVEELQKELQEKTGRRINIKIEEINRPEVVAQLVAEDIAEQLEKRASFRRDDEAGDGNNDGGRRQGDQDSIVRPAGRRGNVAPREANRRLDPPVHAAGENRLRLHRSADRPRATSACKFGSTKVRIARTRPMALMPKRVKHRKSQRGRIRGDAARGNRVVFGDFGLQAMQGGWISAADARGRPHRRRSSTSAPKAGCTSASSPTSRSPRSPWKPAWARAKASRNTGPRWCRPGTVLYEIGGISEEAARMCFARLAHKMPVKVRFLRRRPV